MTKQPIDTFADLVQQPELVPIEFGYEAKDEDDPLTILLRKESTGEFLFSEDNGPYAHLYNNR